MAAILRVEACTSQNLAAIRPLRNHDVSPEWLMHFFDSQYEKVRRLGSGNNQKALNKSILESIEVPLPPVEDQKRLVQLIETETSILKESRRTIERGIAHGRALRRAILADAFAGGLATNGSHSEGTREGRK
jgi:restriction endonuclease S subunit